MLQDWVSSPRLLTPRQVLKTLHWAAFPYLETYTYTDCSPHLWSLWFPRWCQCFLSWVPENTVNCSSELSSQMNIHAPAILSGTDRRSPCWLRTHWGFLHRLAVWPWASHFTLGLAVFTCTTEKWKILQWLHFLPSLQHWQDLLR